MADSPLFAGGGGVLGPVEPLHLVVEAPGEGAEHGGLADGQGAWQAHLKMTMFSPEGCLIK